MQKYQQRLVVIDSNLTQLGKTNKEQLDSDLSMYDMTSNAGTVRLDMLGKIGELVTEMQHCSNEVKTCIGIIKDMQAGITTKES